LAFDHSMKIQGADSALIEKKKVSKMSPAVDKSKKNPEPKAIAQKDRLDRVFERIYRLVLRIPRGRVMTYGQIARLLEGRYSPRLVGWAMHATPHDGRNIPWHRVINSKGGISTGKVILHEPQMQQYLLEAEGVVFNERGCCDLGAYQWSPRAHKRRGTATGRKRSRRAGK
jgi:methylated-DNA-protein-cysteine methyltransferase-like protein